MHQNDNRSQKCWFSGNAFLLDVSDRNDTKKARVVVFFPFFPTDVDHKSFVAKHVGNMSEMIRKHVKRNHTESANNRKLDKNTHKARCKRYPSGGTN